eukprot:scaffold26423_cov35-Phaeocystis_antarctica.AAC.1
MISSYLTGIQRIGPVTPQRPPNQSNLSPNPHPHPHHHPNPNPKPNPKPSPNPSPNPTPNLTSCSWRSPLRCSRCDSKRRWTLGLRLRRPSQRAARCRSSPYLLYRCLGTAHSK